MLLWLCQYTTTTNSYFVDILRHTVRDLCNQVGDEERGAAICEIVTVEF